MNGQTNFDDVRNKRNNVALCFSRTKRIGVYEFLINFRF